MQDNQSFVRELKEFLISVQTNGHKVTTLPSGTRTLEPFFPVNNYDEVYQGIFLGDRSMALDKKELQKRKITHVVNAAQGTKFSQIDTNEAFYADINISFHGIQAMDTTGFQMSSHFISVAEFIHDALKSKGRVYVHCHQGISRSSAVVLAYLILHEKKTLKEALQTVRKKRAIFPNDGFLVQLIELQKTVGDT